MQNVLVTTLILLRKFDTNLAYAIKAHRSQAAADFDEGKVVAREFCELKAFRGWDGSVPATEDDYDVGVRDSADIRSCTSPRYHPSTIITTKTSLATRVCCLRSF